MHLFVAEHCCMRIRLLAIIVFVVVTVGSVQSNQKVTPGDPLSKIAPLVLQQTAGKQRGEFLVVLNDQADLSAADDLPTKEEKGWYVYQTLYTKAQMTQKTIINWLKANGIEHRSFYIVNMIWVRGTFDVAFALASRGDVARIDANPVIHNNIPEPVPTLDTVELGISYSNAPAVWAAGF